MNYQEYYRDKVCVVTGAASGIGLALSKALLRSGATVVMADRDAPTLSSALESLAAPADRARAVEVDVTREAQVRQLIEETASRHGRLDVLFNNAGIPATLPIETATLEHWRRIIDVNLWGVIYGVHYALPLMRRQGSGHIVNTASLAGLLPLPFQALYCTTKYAVVGLSESLRWELADEGVHVSVVCPGNVATRIFGTPVLGERIEAPPPPDAIPADEAAEIILTGVANREGIIILPESLRVFYTSPEACEKLMRAKLEERRTLFLTGGPIS